MINEIPAYLSGFVLCLLLLILFHVFFDKAPEEVRYCLGAGAICCGCSLVGYILSDERLMIGPWIVTFSGLAIIVWQHIERQIEKKKRDAQESGEVIGLARRLAREIDPHGEPDVGTHERRN